MSVSSRPRTVTAAEVTVGVEVRDESTADWHLVVIREDRGDLVSLDLGRKGNPYVWHRTEPVTIRDRQSQDADEFVRRVRERGTIETFGPGATLYEMLRAAFVTGQDSVL